ncbi:MAG: DUF2141 domain-containing protein [Pseudomonadota bacterium]
MPTNTQRFFGVLASIGITIGGAWLASTLHSQATHSALTSFPNGLSADFKNIRNSIGNIVVLVFSERNAYQAYDATKAVAYREVAAKAGELNVSFPDLKKGPYAIVAFHDEDKNQDLNMNGEWPTEGYATSGAIDAFDIPTFAKASVTQETTTIIMHYAD